MWKWSRRRWVGRTHPGALVPARHSTVHHSSPAHSFVLFQPLQRITRSTSQGFLRHITRARQNTSRAWLRGALPIASDHQMTPTHPRLAVHSQNGCDATTAWHYPESRRRRRSSLPSSPSPIRGRSTATPWRLDDDWVVAPRRPFLPRGTFSTAQDRILWIPPGNIVEVIHTPSSREFRRLGSK